jgi:hypothetical protein
MEEMQSFASNLANCITFFRCFWNLIEQKQWLMRSAKRKYVRNCEPAPIPIKTWVAMKTGEVEHRAALLNSAADSFKNQTVYRKWSQLVVICAYF